MSEETACKLSLSVAGLGGVEFLVAALRGEEALSQPYRVTASVLVQGSLAEGDLLGRQASATISLGAASRSLQGVVASFRRLHALPRGLTLYRLELTPRLWLLSLSRERQVYGPDGAASVVEVLRANLLGEGALGVTGEAAAGLAEADVSFRLQHPHPARDFIVQHEESDLAFVSRLMEHEGIFYFFEQGAAGERLVLADDSSVCLPCPGGPAVLPYRPVTALARPEDLTVAAFSQRSRLLPAGVVLKDYNPALPTVDLEVRREVAGGAHGVQLCYGDNYRSRSEGEALAAVRATELACRRILYSGQTTAPHLMPGGLFSLDQHPEEAANQRYLVVRQVFSAGQATPLHREAEPGYRSSFEAVPATAAFAPLRATARPRSAGVLTAWIDGAKKDRRGELDAEGRYRVRLYGDLSGRPEGQASPPLRRCQPQGGVNSGMHFPLQRDTEVLAACVEGDSDRPLLLGALDNAAMPGVVTEASRTLNRIRTTAGTTIEMNDGIGNPGLVPDLALALGRKRHAQAAGRPEAAAAAKTDSGGRGGSGSQGGSGGGRLLDPPDDAATPSTEVTSDGSYIRCYVTDSGHDDEESYLRLGAYEAEAEQTAIEEALGSLDPDQRSGLFSWTDASFLAYVGRDRRRSVAGNQTLVIDGAGDDPGQTLTVGSESLATKQKVRVFGDQSVSVGGAASTSVAKDYTLWVGGDYTEKYNGSKEVVYGGKMLLTVGISGKRYNQRYYSAFFGDSWSMTLGGTITINIGVKEDVRAALDISLAPLIIQDILMRVDLRVFKFSWQATKAETNATKITWTELVLDICQCLAETNALGTTLCPLDVVM